jgi:hypothetical protein
MYKGVQYTNACNTNMLSKFFPEIEEDSLMKADEDTEAVQRICPNLKYSCCKEKQITSLTENLKKANKILDYNYKMITRVYQAINQVAEESYTLFLDELQPEDIECYTNMTENFAVALTSNMIAISSNLKKNTNMNIKYGYKDEFSKPVSIEKFKKMKSLIKSFILKSEELLKDNKKYYSSFICSMCSPSFIKMYKKNSDGKFELEVNKHMCRHINKRKYEFLLAFKIHNYLQDFVNITYCARKNSKKKMYDYDDKNITQYIVYNPLTDAADFVLQPLRKCAYEDESFDQNDKSPLNCYNLCQTNLNFFTIAKMDIRKFIKIENDIDQIFINESDPETAKQRYDKNIQNLEKVITQGGKDGVLKLEGVTIQNYYISMMKLLPEHKFDFDKVPLDVSPHVGLNPFNTPMNSKYYEMEKILGNIGLIVFAILCFKIDSF